MTLQSHADHYSLYLSIDCPVCQCGSLIAIMLASRSYGSHYSNWVYYYSNLDLRACVCVLSDAACNLISLHQLHVCVC